MNTLEPAPAPAPVPAPFNLREWVENRWRSHGTSLDSATHEPLVGFGSAARPRPEDFGLHAYAFASSVSTATGVRSLAHHPFLKALSFSAEPEPPEAAAPPKANGQVAERVRVTVPVPPIRFELSPRQLVDELLSSIVGMGRWRAEVRRDETFAIRDLVLPIIRGDAPAVSTAEEAARLLGTEAYATGSTGSLLCVWDPIDEAAELDPLLMLRATMTGQRLMSLLGKRSKQAYETARTGTRLADRLLVVMAESFGRVYKADLAAQMLKTSERTMRRRLAAEDTSFQQVLDRFRAALAKDYLASTSLPTQLIGELLGFTEATNFRRAFIRWVKVSPHQFRRQEESPLS